MFSQGFTVSGASLALMKTGEQGIVTSLPNLDRGQMAKLQQLGIQPGTSITLEKRFPSFIITADRGRVALDKSIIRFIYVRIAGRIP